MKIHVVADSGSDITQEEAREKNMSIIPLKTTFGDVEYQDGIDISSEKFYELLIESGTLPHTSQASPYEYETHFEEQLKTCDHILCITISSKLSGCYQSACIAADEFPGKVTVVDSENVTLGMRNLVDYALELVESEDDPSVIKDKLDEAKKKIVVLALLDTLEYLKKGGRISTVAAMAGTVLSIKPVVAVRQGEIAVIGKARGSKNGNNMLSECVANRGPIDFEKPYCLAYSGLSDHILQKYIRDNASKYLPENEELPIHMIGSTIGVHVGPGAIGVSYFMK